MNRPIEFRIWIDAFGGEMIYPDSIKINNDGLIESERYYGGMLMQFTGLTDKQGRKIYEGDILKFDYGENCGIGAVEYREIMFMIVSKHGAAFQDTISTMKNSKIIGNIFENPELLK